MHEATSRSRRNARDSTRSSPEPEPKLGSTRSTSDRSRPSFELQQSKVIQLLRDHGDVYGSLGKKDTAPGGEPYEKWPLTPEYIRRFFADSSGRITDEGRSHVRLDTMLRELAALSPLAYRAIYTLHLDPDAGDSEDAHAKEKARRGSSRYKAMIRAWQFGVAALTARLYSPYQDLAVTFPDKPQHHMSVQQRHDAIRRDHSELVRDFPDGRDADHKRVLAERYQVGVRTIERAIKAEVDESSDTD